MSIGVARRSLRDLFAGEDGLDGVLAAAGASALVASPAGKPIFLRIASRSKLAGIGSSWLLTSSSSVTGLSPDAVLGDVDFGRPEDRIEHQLAKVGLAPIPMIVPAGETKTAPAADVFRRPGDVLRLLLFQHVAAHVRDCRYAGRRGAKEYWPGATRREWG